MGGPWDLAGAGKGHCSSWKDQGRVRCHSPLGHGPQLHLQGETYGIVLRRESLVFFNGKAVLPNKIPPNFGMPHQITVQEKNLFIIHLSLDPNLDFHINTKHF